MSSRTITLRSAHTHTHAHTPRIASTPLDTATTTTTTAVFLSLHVICTPNERTNSDEQRRLGSSQIWRASFARWLHNNNHHYGVRRQSRTQFLQTHPSPLHTHIVYIILVISERIMFKCICCVTSATTTRCANECGT